MPQTRRSCAEELEQSRKLDKSTGLSPGREGKSILKPCRQRMPLQEVSDLQFNGDKDGDANELCRNSSRRVSFAVSEVKEFVQPVNEGTLWGNLYVYDIQKSSSESEATTPSCSDLPNVSSASYKSGFVMSQEIVVEETVSVSYSQDVSEDKRQEILHQNHGVRRNLFVDRGNQTDESSFHILGESHNEHQGKCHCNTREIQERNCIEDFVCSYALRSRKSTKLCDEYINNTCSNSHVYQLKRKHSPSQNTDHGDGDDKDDCKASFGVDHKVKKKRRHKNKGNKCGPNSLQNQPSKEENKQVDPTNTESRHFPDCHVIRNECFKIVECNATSSSDSEGDAYRGSLAQNTSFCNREMRDEKNCHMFCQSPSKIDCSGSSMETDSFLSYSIKEENLHCKEEYRTKSHVEPTENILNGSQDEDMSFTLAEGLVLSDLSEGKSSVCTDDKKVDFEDQGKIHSEAREQNTSHTQYFNENVNNTTNIQSCSDNVSVCASPTLAVGKILGSINQEFRSSNAGFSPTIAVGQIFKIETEKSHEIKGILSPISIDKKIILNDSIKSYKVEDKGMCPSFGDSNTANENMELTSADISDDTSSITRGVIFSENHCSENNHFIHTMINSPTKNCEVSTPSSMFRSIFNPKTLFLCNTFQKYKETEEHNCSTYMSNGDDDDSKPCIKNCGSGAEGKSECNTIDNISKPALIKEDSVCNDLQDTSKRKSEFSEPSNHPDEVLSVRESPKHLLATTVNHSGSNFSDSEQCMQFNISERSVSPIVAAGKIFGPANASTKFSNNVSELITSAESDDKCSKSEESMQMDNSEGSLSPTTADGKIFSSVSGLMNIIDSSKTRISKKLCENICSKSEQFVLMGTSGRCVSPTIAAGKIISSESRSDENINNYPRQTICANVTENVVSKSEKVEGNISMCNISHTIPAGKILSSDIIQKIGFVNSSILSTSALLPEDLLPSKFEKPMDMDNSAGRNVSPTMAAGKIFTAENGQDGVNSFIQTTSAKFSANTLPSRFEKPMEMDISGRNLSPTIAAGKILTSEIGKEYDLVNSSMLSANAEFSTHTLSSRFEKPVQMDISGRSVSPTMAAGKIFTSENGKENDLNPSIQTKSSICSVHTLPSRFEKPLEMNVSGRSVSPTLAAGKILTSENGEENDLNPSIQTKSSICSVHTLPSRFEKPLEMNVSGRSISPTIAAGKLLLENKGDLVNFPEQTNSSKVTKDIYSLDSEKNMQMDLLDKSVSPTMAAGKVLTLENERKDDHVNSSQVTAGAQKLPRATKRKRGMDITEETSSIMSIRNECSKNVHGETFKGKYDSHNQIDNFVRNICSNNSGTVEQSVNECNKQISEDLLECRLGNIESSHLLSEKVMKKNITSESVSPTVSGGKVSLDSNIKQNSMACEKLFLNCKVSSDLENSLQKDEGDGICSPTLALGRVFNATNRQLEKANFTEFQGQSILTSSETNNLSSKQKLWTTETISREEVLPDEVVGVNSWKDENTDSKLSLNLQSSALKDKQNNEFHCAANSSVSNFGNDFSESNFCISQNHASANPEATNGRVQDIPDNTLINNSELTRLSPEQNVIDEVFHSRPSSNCRVMNLEKCSRVTEVNKRADNEQEMETPSDMSDFVPLNPSVTCERIDYDVKIDCNDVGNSDVPSPARYYKSSEVNITNGNVLIRTGKEKRHCEEELSNCTNWSENCDGYLGQEKKKYKTTNISPLPHFTKVPLINSPINYINLEKSIDVNYVMETDDEIDSEKNIPYTNTHSTSVSHLPLTDTDIGRNSVTSEKNSSESSNSLIDVSKLSENDGDISVMDCIRSMREKDLEDRENESRRSIVMSPSHNVSSANRKSFQANSFQKPEFKQSFHGSRKDTKEILVSPLPNKKLKYFGNANKGDVFDEINNENHEETQKSRSQINLFDTEIGHPYSQNNNSMELQESVFSSPTSRKCDNVVSSIALVEIKCDVAEENLNNLSTNLQTPSTDAYLESKKVLSPSSQIFNESKTSEEKLYGKTHTNEFPNNSTQNDHLGAYLENARFSSPNLNSVCKSNMFSVSHEMVRETTEPITYVHQEIPARNIDEEKNNSLKYSNKSSVSSGTTLQNSVTTFSGSPCSVELWIEEHQKRFDCAWTFVSITNTTMNFYFIERQLHILINIDPCDCSINILTYSNISGNKMKLLMNVFMMRKLDPKYLELHFRKKNDIPSLITYVTQQIDFFFDFFQDWLHLLIQHNIQIDSNLRVTFKVFSLVLSWCCKVSVDFSDWDGGRRQMKHITVLREVGEASTDDIRKLIRGVPAGPHILKDYIKHIHDYINIKESLEGHVD